MLLAPPFCCYPAPMWPDIIDMRSFYASRLGMIARRMLRRQIRELWPDIDGGTLVGLGYATPYLRPYVGRADHVAALMPAGLGAHTWPADGPGLVAMTDEDELPLADAVVDRVLLVHAVEFSVQPHQLLRECWRILAPGGRLLAIVPNRRGIWARVDRTPFGHGHPYSQGQITQLLREAMFVPTRAASGLFMPPTSSRLVSHAAPALERLGVRWFAPLGGAVVVEAEKQVYAVTPAKRAPRRTRKGALAPVRAAGDRQGAMPVR